MQSIVGRHFSKIALLVLLAAAFFIYSPGLMGDFIFDDYINIVNNANVALNELTLADIRKVLSSGIATTLSRPLSMLTFGFNYYLAGFNPFYFKLTNLLIHLAVSAGIYLLTLELLKLAPTEARSDVKRLKILSLVVAACWALHPLNVSTVLYIVQRMTQLSALASICALLYYCKFRQLEVCTRRDAIVAFGIICVVTVVGVLFKENAALTVLFILCIEAFLTRFRAATEGHKLFLKLFTWLMLVIPALCVAALLVISPETFLEGYESRTFSLAERTITEARVLWRYIGWLLLPDTRDLTFYYDNFPPSRSITEPVTTAFAIVGLLAIATFCFVARRRMPILCFGLAFFFAGHAMESTILPLELMFEHRNYLPGYGVILGVIYAFRHLPLAFIRKELVTFLLGVYVVFLAHGTYTESVKWSDSYNHLAIMTSQNPDSHRANYGMGYFLLTLSAAAQDRRPVFDLAAEYFQRSAKLDPHAIRGHVGVIQANSQNGKAIDPALLDDLYLRVRNNPNLPSYNGEISNLIECWYAGFCRFDGTILTGLFNAMASNTASSPYVVQGMLDQIGSAIADIFDRKSDGRAVLYLARNVRPEVTVIDLKLIRLEMELGNYDQARALLEQAQSKNVPNFSDELARLQTALEDI